MFIAPAPRLMGDEVGIILLGLFPRLRLLMLSNDVFRQILGLSVLSINPSRVLIAVCCCWPMLVAG